MENKIKALLEELGITTYRFAQETGMSQGTAYALVNDPGKYPAKAVLEKICDTYTLQPSDVLVFKELPNPE